MTFLEMLLKLGALPMPTMTICPTKLLSIFGIGFVWLVLLKNFFTSGVWCSA